MLKASRPNSQSVQKSGVIIVTGTDTGVGKTIVTAAVAALLTRQRLDVHVYKPVQTGLIAADHPKRGELEQRYSDVVVCGDAQLAGALAGCSYSTGATFELPMAPSAAAAKSADTLPTSEEHAGRIHKLLQHHDLVIAEGAGGLLVDLGGHTLADIGRHLQDEFQIAVQVIVVARSQLGTLNHTALTVEALQYRGLLDLGVMLGAWPAQPSAVELSNRDELARSYPLPGLIPQGSGALTPSVFQTRAPSWFDQASAENA